VSANRISVKEYRQLIEGAKRKRKRGGSHAGKDGTLYEEGEQRLLAALLDGLELNWFHVPNGGARCGAEGGKLKAQGCKAGVLENFIVDPPPNGPPGCPGVVIELKRKGGGKVSAAQRKWLEILQARGWIVAVCHGADEAKIFVFKRGYKYIL